MVTTCECRCHVEVERLFTCNLFSPWGQWISSGLFVAVLCHNTVLPFAFCQTVLECTGEHVNAHCKLNRYDPMKIFLCSIRQQKSSL